MPSPRSSPRASPALRPTSPLMYSNYSVGMTFETVQNASSRQTHTRTAYAPRGARREFGGSLKLPSLPRFHPANYPSVHSSVESTPDGTASPRPATSPRAHQRLYSEAQKHLYAHQRDMMTSGCAVSPSHTGKPVSPRLAPLGSPGPVTPLVLEGEEGYLVAGARSAGDHAPTGELVDRMIKEESRRQRAVREETTRSQGHR